MCNHPSFVTCPECLGKEEGATMLEPKTRAAEIFLDNASGSELWGKVPSHTQDAIIEYLNREYPVSRSSFLYAVLTNDLKTSVMRADRLNRNRLVQIVASLYEYAPRWAWGSEADVKAFLENGEETP